MQNINKIMTLIWIILASGFISFSAHNPFGIRYSQELIIVITLLYTFLSLLYSRPPKDITLIILFIPIFASTYSAFRANVVFGQPFLMGMIEERRMFELWFFFPIWFHMERIKSNYQIMRTVYFSSIIICIVGIGYTIGIIPPIHHIITNTSMREGRATTSATFISLVLITSYSFLSDRNLRSISLTTFFMTLVYIVVVTQTRQLMIACTLVVAFLTFFGATQFKTKVISLAILIYGGVFGAVILSTMSLSQWEMVGLFSQLFSEDYLQNSSRATTIVKIMDSITYFGNGALWLQWNYGFVTYFGDTFFLSDVGIFGTIYRYGLFSIFYIFICFYLLYKLYHRSNIYSKQFKKSVVGVILLFVVLLPTAGLFEYKGETAAILAALVCCCNRNSLRDRLGKPLLKKEGKN